MFFEAENHTRPTMGKPAAGGTKVCRRAWILQGPTSTCKDKIMQRRLPSVCDMRFDPFAFVVRLVK